MRSAETFQRLADAVLLLHFGVVLFVVAGLALIVIGNLVRWRWVNALWFRLAHLVAIAIVVAEAWLGITCPLTSLEMWLRAQSGATAAAYSDSFVGYWLRRMLYYTAPAWAFALAYSVFAALVIAAWFWFPPNVNGRTLRRRSPR